MSDSLHQPTAVEQYWSEHVVCATKFRSAEESLDYLGWRFRSYPLFREFSGLYGEHRGEVILDYGCGPGNDLVGFVAHSRAPRIIGMDVSPTALALARERLALHPPAHDRVELLQGSDRRLAIDLPDESVDFINCQGVLHHVSDPEQVLKEFFRILKPTGRAVVMVYNRNSVWLHLYTAYERLVLENAFSGMDAIAAFSKNVDGEACPMARCYANEEFQALCGTAGFDVQYMGGYLSDTEMAALTRSLTRALADDRLPQDHKEFLRALEFDPHGFPLFRGYHAGIGGVYKLYAWKKAGEGRAKEVRDAVKKSEEADAASQRAEIQRYYLRVERQLAELESRFRNVVRENEDLRRWQSRVLGVPGVSLALAFRRWAHGRTRSA